MISNMSNNLFMEIESYIKENIRPRVQGDGGDLELVDIRDNKIYILALNECSICPLTVNCFKNWLEEQLNQQFQLDYQLLIEIKKPYFWDKLEVL